MAQSPKVKSITVTKSQQRTLEESGPVARTVKEQGKKDANAVLLLSMVYSSGSPLSKRYYSQGYHPNHSAKMILSRMTRDQVIPCLVKLMAEMNHHIQVPYSNAVVLSWRFLWSQDKVTIHILFQRADGSIQWAMSQMLAGNFLSSGIDGDVFIDSNGFT